MSFQVDASDVPLSANQIEAQGHLANENASISSETHFSPFLYKNVDQQLKTGDNTQVPICRFISGRV